MMIQPPLSVEKFKAELPNVNMKNRDNTTAYHYINPLFLAHHPLCDRFAHHVIKICGHKFCAGCTIEYTTILVTLILAIFTQFFQRLSYINFLTLAGISLAVSLLRLVHSKSIFFIIVPRVGLGFALTTALLSVWHAPTLILKIIIFYSTMEIIALYLLYKIKTFFAPCIECNYRSQFPSCPGLKPNLYKLKTYLYLGDRKIWQKNFKAVG